MTRQANDMLCTALDLAEKAASFYQDACDACHDALGAEFFQWLANEKTRSLEEIRSVSVELSKGKSWGDACGLPDEETVAAAEAFRDKAAGRVVSGAACLLEVEALKAAMDMEKGLTGFYQSRLGQARDVVERAFIEHMLGQGRGHVLLVEDMLAYYEDPEAWNSGLGRVGLDGA